MNHPLDDSAFLAAEAMRFAQSHHQHEEAKKQAEEHHQALMAVSRRATGFVGMHSMETLNGSHKNVLREFVRLIQSGEIPEEFTLMWGTQHFEKDGVKRSWTGALYRGINGFQRFRDEFKVSEFTCEVLSQVGLIVARKTPHGFLDCYITPAGYSAVTSDFAPVLKAAIENPPAEIAVSLERFREDFPNPKNVAFVMMRFGDTDAHSQIFGAIKQALAAHSLTALRADDKAYHDDLFPNILTYIHGCHFGIAVFERIEGEVINPNVALEVGYMMAMGKSVCFLKDRTLKTLQADLIGKLYQDFDSHAPEKAIPGALSKWMKDKKIIASAP